IYGKRRLREIDRRLGHLARIMKQAKVVDPAKQPSRDEVRFGATVELADDDDNRRTFTIVGDDEADATAGKIGWSAPLARALIGGMVGPDEHFVGVSQAPWALPAPDQSLILNVGADVEVKLDQQGSIIALLRLEFVDLVEYPRDRFFSCPAEHAILEHAAVPA